MSAETRTARTGGGEADEIVAVQRARAPGFAAATRRAALKSSEPRGSAGAEDHSVTEALLEPRGRPRVCGDDQQLTVPISRRFMAVETDGGVATRPVFPVPER